jgi:hypothetical protein
MAAANNVYVQFKFDQLFLKEIQTAHTRTLGGKKKWEKIVD